MSTRRSRSRERKDTFTFLNILKKYYPRIVKDNSTKIVESPLWDEVLEECKKNGIFMDKTPEYLAQKRWPASIGILRKTSKKRGPLSEKDQLVVEIERYRTPDFCYGKLDGDKDGEQHPSRNRSTITVHEEDDGSSNDNYNNNQQPSTRIVKLSASVINGSNEEQQQNLSSRGGNSSNRGTVTPIGRAVIKNESFQGAALPAVAAQQQQNLSSRGTSSDQGAAHTAATAAAEIHQPIIDRPLSINEIFNEPNESLRHEYYQAAIRAFNVYSELTELKLQMIRDRQPQANADN